MYMSGGETKDCILLQESIFVINTHSILSISIQDNGKGEVI